MPIKPGITAEDFRTVPRHYTEPTVVDSLSQVRKVINIKKF
jgi:hypothetical protein